jgi:hypothetical protein
MRKVFIAVINRASPQTRVLPRCRYLELAR